MHTLHTVEAFVIQSYPHGESNRTYKLLTRDRGMLYAHGQGVRELKSKNRFALQRGNLSEVTLVRGREKWRITGAKSFGSDASYHGRLYQSKLLTFVGGNLPIEDPLPDVFDIIKEAHRALACRSEQEAGLIEVLTMVRLMHVLGFVSRVGEEDRFGSFFDSKEITDEDLTQAQAQLETIRKTLHNARVVAE